ncbi:pseudouridylate synthase [bacterium (Candidatus Blackallbacteria) CG17_big_fil_post_rev_8_21_14_2_50_48_46]|uniref:tRNA pseudouridine synthase C n=1 Tax=bacterium (Candidatus Blackallbacteria) CG17_big_fil_post_rev_8_21_14_2_50_48_46 TaxID=2014261 RepID=A0A2M7G031_9BACT|nr:MAG: pseudouridylate synthase [bacterium (Candidatus Blackallbacteria) CG18_big_fil_WC_8_21_14_2_50_49_26]PIW14539.1 MAG: pseudouridylate synthase [bacterium (Candidatus Blackallbacteria) CG17_big_fil_post_rev_8_21_14_2_50_48_46]PIW47224.1 MAG: pseudouridylate synthase [bacterium (Candidatus Blackallbacteria) CG13_big_fil_rev_8_21_14_2_50_49_14]
MELPIIYRDERFIAIHKPAGLLVHRSPIDASETEFAVQKLRVQIDRPVFPLHRLDKPTSGLLIFAFDSEAASRLSEQFSNHTIQKSYLAIVRGYSPDQAHIDYPVKAQQDKYFKTNIQQGITDLSTLAKCELEIANDRYEKSRYSLVELRPQTGKRHQLRYHMKHISHPIIGDPKYGKKVHNDIFKAHFDCSRLLLASIGLRFTHPFRHEQVTITCLPSDDFMAVAKPLGWEDLIRSRCQP